MKKPDDTRTTRPPGGTLRVTPALSIAESELDESFVRASGPGGQNVNKVATAVQLRFDLDRSTQHHPGRT